MPIIEECHSFLTNDASGTWHETYRLKNKETDKYEHEVSRGTIVLRIETGTKRAFYWLYNIDDVVRFVEFVGLKLKAEAHEIIIRRQCRLFYDIDLKLDEFQKNDLAEIMGYNLAEQSETAVMDAIADKIAIVFKEASVISLEEHGVDIDHELSLFDWMYTSRNRPLENDGYKISLHVITNLMLPVAVCAAIIDHVKHSVIPDNVEVLDIDHDIVDLIADSIDVGQCRYHGSLSLPYGTKNGKTNVIRRNYDIPGQRYFLTIDDQYTIHDVDTKKYNVAETFTGKNVAASPEFVKEALKHINNVADYSSRAWDINGSVLKGSTMYVKRSAPSMCSICDRSHDNDNTLFLIFNSEAGVASWKCARSMESRAIPFYTVQPVIQSEDNDDDIEGFVTRFKQTKKEAVANRKSPVVQKTKFLGRPIPEADIADVEEFTKKYHNLKDTSTKEIFDDKDSVPYIPLHQKSARPVQHDAELTSTEVHRAETEPLDEDLIEEIPQEIIIETVEGYSDRKVKPVEISYDSESDED